MADGRKVRGQRSREAILGSAVALASVDGLDGLTLGRLAGVAGVSKSGLFAHWRDKEQLQLDAVEWARRQWIEHVVTPALAVPQGLRRVLALHEARLAFYEEGRLPGGCFFFAAQVEFDDRPGPVKDRVAEAMNDWLGFLERAIQDAVDRGELRADPAQLAYEIEALGEAVVIHSRLRDRPRAFAHARRAVLDRLRALSPDPTLLPED
ncbi:TetR/AcrR family transcriptional regulator [Nonomuraea sp. NPDC003804]|uniref:TetR/AcrR family transcriptional regulator n=1 Tax=Nonomuraea sp. NPDC003804 TaxID=3154547 RepID=UPI0033B9AA92